jgi:hypothetical protein
VSARSRPRCTRSLAAHLVELERDELEALLLEALDHLADEAALHAVGLDHDVRALGGHLVRVWAKEACGKAWRVEEK